MMKSGSRQKAILVIYLRESAFVGADIEILQSRAPIIKYHFKRAGRPVGMLYQVIHLFLFLLINMRQISLIYSWFNDFHTFLPVILGRLFNKKSVIVVGGVDAKGIPELKYGVFRKKNLRSFCVKMSYKFADLIIPVDESLINSVNYYINPSGIRNGILNFIPGLKTPIKVIPTGYNPDKWTKLDTIERRDSVLSIAGIWEEKTFLLKGFDILIKLAETLPGIRFTLIGLSAKMIERYAPRVSSNVILLSYQSQENLLRYYRESKVYAQFSLTEGLPNSLCEAMLCECIPVGSAVDGIPNAIGDCGYILKTRDVNLAKEILIEALNSNPQLGLKARDRIIELFPVQKRKDLLQSLIVSAEL